ncbi:MAG: hypothetical protein WCV92_00565 [Candidatus Buchananbacteria bacterium]
MSRSKITAVPTKTGVDATVGLFLATIVICGVIMLGGFGASMAAGIIGTTSASTYWTCQDSPESANNFILPSLVDPALFKTYNGDISKVKFFDVYTRGIASCVKGTTGKLVSADKCIKDVCTSTTCTPIAVASCTTQDKNCRLQESFILTTADLGSKTRTWLQTSATSRSMINSWKYNCPNGCSNGACVKESILITYNVSRANENRNIISGWGMVDLISFNIVNPLNREITITKLGMQQDIDFLMPSNFYENINWGLGNALPKTKIANDSIISGININANLIAPIKIPARSSIQITAYGNFSSTTPSGKALKYSIDPSYFKTADNTNIIVNDGNTPIYSGILFTHKNMPGVEKIDTSGILANGTNKIIGLMVSRSVGTNNLTNLEIKKLTFNVVSNSGLNIKNIKLVDGTGKQIAAGQISCFSSDSCKDFFIKFRDLSIKISDTAAKKFYITAEISNVKQGSFLATNIVGDQTWPIPYPPANYLLLDNAANFIWSEIDMPTKYWYNSYLLYKPEGLKNVIMK